MYIKFDANLYFVCINKRLFINKFILFQDIPKESQVWMSHTDRVDSIGNNWNDQPYGRIRHNRLNYSWLLE